MKPVTTIRRAMDVKPGIDDTPIPGYYVGARDGEILYLLDGPWAAWDDASVREHNIREELCQKYPATEYWDWGVTHWVGNEYAQANEEFFRRRVRVLMEIEHRVKRLLDEVASQ